MKPTAAYGGYVALALSIVLLSSRSAYSGGQASGGLVRLQPTTPGLAQTGSLNINGTAIAGQFQGGGMGLTNLDASNLASGVLIDARLSTNVPLLSSNNAFAGVNTFGNYVLVGRSTRITTAESFGVGNTSTGFDGMYVRTGATGLPFYGYSLNGIASAYHYVDGGDAGKWKLYNGGVRLTVDTAGNVGVGTATPIAKLEVSSQGVYGLRASSLLGSGNAYGGYFSSASTAGYGVFSTSVGLAGVKGEVTASGGNGVFGSATAASSNGVYGVSEAGSGQGTGGWFEALSPQGTAVRAVSSGPYGVRAQSNLGTGVTYGGHFTSLSSSGYGVFGTTNGLAGVCGEVTIDGSNGVIGRTAGASGNGVYGVALSSSGSTVGGSFESLSSGGTGVFANSAGPYGLRAKSTLGTGVTYGVYGEVSSALGFGGYFLGRGYFSGNVGIGTSSPTEMLEVRGGGGPTSLQVAPGKYYGTSTASAVQFDIPGTGNVLFWDNLHVNNTLTAGAKNFRIDHPLDPYNQFLQHGCVESDEYRNLYDGEVTTDAKGVAVVTLPRWFEALNTKIRYQLTVVDEDSEEFVQVKVFRRLRDGAFSLKTSRPQVTVCWQLTGVRKDAYVAANPLIVELDKPESLRGRLIHQDARAPEQKAP